MFTESPHSVPRLRSSRLSLVGLLLGTVSVSYTHLTLPTIYSV